MDCATLLGSLGALVSFGYYYKYYREANEFEKERLAKALIMQTNC